MAEEACRNSQTTSHSLFIDTTLGTHLVMTVKDKDTVGDFKRKLVTEHPRCFPDIGKVKIHSVKVRRRGCFYHLLDSLLVKNAFIGFKKSWFVYVDAACIQTESIKKPLYLEAGDYIRPLQVVNGTPVEAGGIDVDIHQNSKRVSTLDDSSVPKVGSSDLVNKLVPLLGSGTVTGGTLDAGDLGGKLPSSENRVSSSLGDIKRFESEAQGKANLVCESNELPNINTNDKKKKSRKRSRDVLCDDAVGVDLQSKRIVKKPLLCEQKVEERDSGICMSSEDTSSGQLRNNKELSKGNDAPSLPQAACLDPTVKSIGQQSTVPCSSQDTLASRSTFAAEAAVGDMDLESDNVEMGGVGGRKLEGRIDSSEKTMAVGGRKAKQSKRHQAETVKQAEHDVKDGVVSSNPLDVPSPVSKRKKKSKKNKDADMDSREKSLDRDLYALETNKVSTQNDTKQALEVLSSVVNTEADVSDKIKTGKSLTPNGGFKMHPEEIVSCQEQISVKDVDVNSKPVGIEDQVSSAKRKKKSKKTKSSKVDQGIELENDSLQLALVVRDHEITDMYEKTPSSTLNTPLKEEKDQEVVDIKDPSLLVKENKLEEKTSSKKKKKSKSKKDSSVIQGEAHEASTMKSMDTPVLMLQPAQVDTDAEMKEAVKTEDHSLLNKEDKTQEQGTTKKTRKSKSKKDSSINHLSNKMAETENDSGSQTIPSQKHQIGANDHTEVSGSVGDEVNFKDYFVPKKATVPHKDSRNKIVDSSENGRSISAVQFHSPTGVSVQSSLKVNNVGVSESHRKEAGDVLNNSGNHKSPLAAPSKIFSESSTETSEDTFDAYKGDSDASTKTPSDTSSFSDHSSDHSEGESEVHLQSPGHGSSGKKVKEIGENSIIRPSQVGAPNPMALDAILRSSRSYKKAKITASQSQPEDNTETQTQPTIPRPNFGA